MPGEREESGEGEVKNRVREVWERMLVTTSISPLLPLLIDPQI